jgi:hypothetical protein
MTPEDLYDRAALAFTRAKARMNRVDDEPLIQAAARTTAQMTPFRAAVDAVVAAVARPDWATAPGQLLRIVAPAGPGPCGVKDGGGREADADVPTCNFEWLHGDGSAIHTEMRDGKLWAQWRSVLPEDECTCYLRERGCRFHDHAEWSRQIGQRFVHKKGLVPCKIES